MTGDAPLGPSGHSPQRVSPPEGGSAGEAGRGELSLGGKTSLLGLCDEVQDQAVLERAIERFRRQQILLPTFADLARPTAAVNDGVDPDSPDPRNLFRVHWHNDHTRRSLTEVPDHVVVPNELTGIEATVVMALGNRFPMIRAHKVLAAYACLAPRIVTGAFDPSTDRAVWPSTGNYARGGVAISRIMDSRGVAVLPEGMSRERFEWLDSWITEPADVIRTPGTESNVKEIYDTCAQLARDPHNVILNQFSEFGNHLAHFQITGTAMQRIFQASGGKRLAAFVAASGSAGTLGAGDYLKEVFSSRIVAVEALECPTMLYNGYGEHNIQGIGDKHIPLIHNASNTDDVVAITDRATDHLLLAFNTEAGREYLRGRGVDPTGLENLGLSSIANLLAAVRVAKHHRLGRSDVILTVATDGAEMYGSEIDRILDRDFSNGYGSRQVDASFQEFLSASQTGDYLQLDDAGRRRIFNLGYYTWVEQQGVPFPDFEARREQKWWQDLRPLLERWDALIIEFNEQTGVSHE
ncbi:MAG: pyridoxal-phosphate dependent enzyme [Acidimicrobiia bacterium]